MVPESDAQSIAGNALQNKIQFNSTVCQSFVLQLSMSFWGKYGIPLCDAVMMEDSAG